MKIRQRVNFVIGFAAGLYFLLLVLSGFGIEFFGAFMFTELGIIFFLAMVFLELTFLTM